MECEMLLWQDWEYNPNLSWQDYLKLFEQGTVKVTRPANGALQCPNVDFQFDLGVLISAGKKVTHPKDNRQQQDMMDERMNVYEFHRTIEEHERVDCLPCPPCAAKWYLSDSATASQTDTTSQHTVEERLAALLERVARVEAENADLRARAA